ncbi:hypothetical protein ABDK56_12105 [Sphingomonas sp. ASV193]
MNRWDEEAARAPNDAAAVRSLLSSLNRQAQTIKFLLAASDRRRLVRE